MVEMLREVNNIVMKMRYKDCRGKRARAYFDSVFEASPTLEARLDVDGRIIRNSFLEVGVVKIQDHGEES